MARDLGLDLFPQELVAQYAPIRTLGAGGMGAVYLAEDRALGREVAVKLVRQDARPSLQQRFMREAQALAKLDHPGLNRIYSFGIAGEVPYIVMEYLQGGSLDHVAPGADFTRIMLDAAGALEALHARGLVHRDIKPANIFLTREGRVVLIDLGLAKDSEQTSLTAEGVIVGTLGYLAPEVATGGAAGPEADWFAWGVSLYALHERGFPYAKEHLLAMAAGEPPPPPSFTNIPDPGPVAELVRAALAHDPRDRPFSRAACEAILAGRPMPARPAPPRPAPKVMADPAPPPGPTPAAAATTPVVPAAPPERKGLAPAIGAVLLAVAAAGAALLPQRDAAGPSPARAEAGAGGEAPEVRELHAALTKELELPVDQIGALAIGPGGRFAVADVLNRASLLVWDLPAGARAPRRLDLEGDLVSEFGFLDPGRLVVGVAGSPGGRVVDLAALEASPWDGPDLADARLLEVSPDGGTLLVAPLPDGGGFALRDLRAGKPLGEGGFGVRWEHARFSADGRRLVLGGEGSLLLWDVPGRAEKLFREFPAGGVGVAMSPDGRRVAAVHGDAVHLLDGRDGAEKEVFRPGGRLEGTARFLRGGDALLLSAFPGTALFLDTRSGRTLGALPRKERSYPEVAVTPDETRVLRATRAGVVEVWEIEVPG